MTHVDNQTGERTNAGTGYAGHGEGVNNPTMQNVPNVSPIPQGCGTYLDILICRFIPIRESNMDMRN